MIPEKTWERLHAINRKLMLSRLPIGAIAGSAIGSSIGLCMHHVSWWYGLLISGLLMSLLSPVIPIALHCHYFSRRATIRRIIEIMENQEGNPSCSPHS